MTDTLLIDAVPGETRVALLVDDEVVSIDIEREDDRSHVGDLYLGRVEAVEPSLQAAFIALPDGPPGFLALKHMTALTPPAPNAPRRVDRLVQDGEAVLVQITKEATEDKGPQLTTHVSLPGRMLVYQPNRTGTAVSAKLTDDTERKRLLALTEQAAQMIGTGGFILRTRAEGATDQAITAEAKALMQQWQQIEQTAKTAYAPALLHRGPDIIGRTLRDHATASDRFKIIVDSHALLARVKAECARQAPHAPMLAETAQVHTGTPTLFNQFGVEEAIDQALDNRLDIQAGGWIAIDQTEALTAIDVNSGEGSGERTLEQTALHTDLNAIPLIARQLRLRDIGGMIVIDFITTQEKSHRAQIIAALKTAFATDPSPSVVLGWTRMGLVEMTRRRRQRPLPDLLSDTPPSPLHRRKSAATIGYDILRRLKAEAAAAPGHSITVSVHPQVKAWLEVPARQQALKTLTAGRVMIDCTIDQPVDVFDVTADL